jgi:hypothetical protein
MPGLTPGDFALVARRAALLKKAWTIDQLSRDLETEAGSRLEHTAGARVTAGRPTPVDPGDGG